MQVQILTPEESHAKLRRMAAQLHEATFGEGPLTLLGVEPRGYWVAQLLAEHLRTVRPDTVEVVSLPRNLTDALPAGLDLTQGTTVLVDDVLYSGATQAQALARIVPLNPRRVLVAVLVDRGHLRYPVLAQIVGLPLATTLLQYVKVEREGTGFGAYLLEEQPA
jgi:pyrimidine operon attenuation protein/uracil phosphoribosyltransferase